ncbi:sensor histidine kinase [Niveispirillum irakense]|uniref:sensor histidine kinase n=1 Tax=Niveispirillum irakense TaxID=34011 RepID=UPI00048DB577|nr:histidine kinase dimerization/phosphoacceptor domain -containing protein [Niveispirillum irakense]
MAFLSQALEKLVDEPRSLMFRYGLAVAATVIAWATRHVADPILPQGFPFLTFFPAVILTALWAGLWPGILAGVLSGLTAWYFFIPTLNSFDISGPTALALAFYALVIGVDIAIIHLLKSSLQQLRQERGRAQMAESKALDHARHRDVLFAELQHRVSNNLQIVSALLSLQRAGVSDEKARAALADAANRLALIGSIHRRLYNPGSENVDFGQFLRDLSDDLLTTAGMENVASKVEAVALSLPPHLMVPVALIVAELISNSLEHAFIDRPAGEIAITVQTETPGHIAIAVRDDGRGLPSGFDLEKTESLGLRLVRLLAQQIGARFEMMADGGTHARLLFAPD